MLALVNLLGTAFGFYYYLDQIFSTPMVLWIFVPASPIATFFFASSIYLNSKDRGLPLLDTLAFISNFKYGLWTVFCLLYYWDIFFTGNSVGLYTFMILSHLGMFIQSFMVFNWNNINLRLLVLTGLWYIINDFVDYTFGTHTELYTEYVLPAELAAYSLTIAAFFSGLTLIQKDRFSSKIRELRGI
ncbi:MAG: DUF1405 domain-containing protein [Candidatus Nanohaloarchaea archaeon]